MPRYRVTFYCSVTKRSILHRLHILRDNPGKATISFSISASDHMEATSMATLAYSTFDARCKSGGYDHVVNDMSVTEEQ